MKFQLIFLTVCVFGWAFSQDASDEITEAAENKTSQSTQPPQPTLPPQLIQPRRWDQGSFRQTPQRGPIMTALDQVARDMKDTIKRHEEQFRKKTEAYGLRGPSGDGLLADAHNFVERLAKIPKNLSFLGRAILDDGSVDEDELALTASKP